MKKIWFGIGAAVIIILLLLQTKFNIYMRVEESGYAISGNSLKQTLMLEPDEAEEEITFPYYHFEALDYIYSRGSKYYMGEKKKQEIDLGFPLYVNGGAGILFTDGSSTLFDVCYEEVKAYSGMVISERIAYNPGGDRADATEYLFCKLTNGLFINLDTVIYEDRGETRQIDMNSIVYFTESYFAYSEQNGGEGNYQVCRNMKDTDIVIVNGEELTYHELLVRLHIITDKVAKATGSPDAEATIEPIPTPTPEQLVAEETEEETEETEKPKEEKTPSEKPAKAENTSPKTAQIPSRTPVQPVTRPAQRPPKKPAAEQPPRGVRPDHMRPDKNSPKEPAVVEYVKPTVTVNNVTAGVYRIILDVAVNDPAGRLHTLRKAQFEFYEVWPDGTETLVYRTYTGSSNTHLTAGNGSIKPNTTYRINAYFTYNDEYDNMIVESIPLGHITTLNDSMITTLPFDSLGVIDFGSPEPEYYYDYNLELPDVRYTDSSDEEAVYGINRSAGIKLIIEGNSITNTGFKSETSIDGKTIRNFKDHVAVLLKSASDLAPKSQYRFTIEAEDYFGNKLTVTGNTGEFETCKSRPVGKLEIVKNKIGDFQMQVNVTDPDESAIPVEGGTDYDMYLVIATQRSEVQAVTKEECDAYLTNGGPAEGSIVAYAYKFSSDEYLNADSKINIDEIVKITQLDLNQKYFAYLYCDYDLNNKKEPVRFGEIGKLAFTSASLSSLGDIYIKVDISNVTAHSATIAYTLNTDRTVDELEQLLSSVRFDIVRSKGEEEVTDSYIQFDTAAMTAFTGYDHGTNDNPIDFPWELWANENNPAQSVMMDASFFDGSLSEEQNALKSVTDYVIKPVVKATYNGKEYDMKVTITNSSFKTLKEPATVEVENLLLAAGTLRFNVRINDPDEAIIGNSGHVVRMNLYQQDGTFVRALRIPKNTEEFQAIEIKNLATDKTFKLSFIALEYNEGYTNAFYESNKILKEILINDSLDLSGTIKLQDIVSTNNSGKLCANVKATLNDKEKVLENSQYYIKVEKNGMDVTASAGYPSNYPVSSDDYSSTVITDDLQFLVDKGNNTYKLTLYAVINDQYLELDTLTFTSEQTVESISSAEEFIWKIKKNNGAGKYVITNDITLDSGNSYKNPDNPSQTATPRSIVSSFNGQIDFQGYVLDYTYRGNGSRLFSNIGSKGDISNMVFHVKMENAASGVNDDGVFSRLNYGHIHDVIVCYKGGEAAKNIRVGLLCRVNAVSGLIENFVVSNEPEEGTMPFSVWKYGGLVCSENMGMIRNGYAYGDPIFTDLQAPSVGGALYVGGIAGQEAAGGKISNVYSMVNVSVASKERSSNQMTEVTRYGSVVGSAEGIVSNVYGIGQSIYNGSDAGYNKAVGPVLGYNSGRTGNVYYWNENEANDYSDSAHQTAIGLESLYDYGWHAGILGSQFITSNVEVGYYPHVILSEELPAQPYIPLPERAAANYIELMSSSVIEYVDDGQAAIVEFRFSNTQNAEIKEINIENLTTEIDVDSIHSVDGYTTLRAKVSNPQRYCSAYEIIGVKYYLKGNRTLNFDPRPILLADFYRNISTVDEWYDYVVCQPTENARLTADIDFSGVPESRIVVKDKYTGKLDGRSTDDTSAGHIIKNITADHYVFANMSGEITNLCVENLTVTGTTQVSRNGFTGDFYGVIDNVHVRNININGYGYIGGIAGYAYPSSEISNSSVNNIVINYKEPVGTNSWGRIGGIVGYGQSLRITSCYVRDLDMKVLDIANCSGAGGLIGYADTTSIENAYVTGSMTVRGLCAGGIAGCYAGGETSTNFKNVLSRVNVYSYQDQTGGIAGTATISYMLNARNNISGVALGSVFANNPDAQNVSFTVGKMSGAAVGFYGSEVQLLNGMAGQEKDKNTYGMLTLEQIYDPSAYTNVAGMDAVFDYTKAEDGHLPTLYYEGTKIELPFQSDIPLSVTEIAKNEIQVKDVLVTENTKSIIVDVKTTTEADYKITALTIENLKQDDGQQLISAVSQGSGRVVTHYLDAAQQEHWQDSYLLTRIDYTKTLNGTTTVGYADFSDDPVRIPLTLYADIYSVETWGRYINEDNNYGNYENYRIVDDIDFSGKQYTINAKIGRLKGSVAGNENEMATLSNINLSGKMQNFIFRLNSELSNICFENCSVRSSDRTVAGLIGTSAAEIHDMKFENIKVENRSWENYTGIIGLQLGGKLENITMGTIEVKSPHGYVGGLVGYSKDDTRYKNITGKDITVTGGFYVGGMLGATARAYFQDISLEDVKVTGSGDFIGGVIGNNDSPRTSNQAPYMWNVSIKGTPTKDASGRVTDSTTVVQVASTVTAIDTGKYVGGIVGRCGGYQIGFGRTDGGRRELSVEGIVVKGHSGYVGGAFGDSHGCQYVTVKDAFITINNNNTYNAVRMYAGGLSGYHEYENHYNNVYNVTIDVSNYARVGLLTGYKGGNSNTKCCYVHDSQVTVSKKNSGLSVYDIGGLIGRSDGTVDYSGVYNSSVIAEAHGNVGGVAGYANTNVNRCFYYAEPESNDSPAAKEIYQVKGATNVGGISGVQNNGTLGYSYSNANVNAAIRYAGGLIGRYRNNYTVSKVSGKLTYGYSGVSMCYNYFAGTVKAKQNAGGAIGSNGMAVMSTNTEGVVADHITNGGRNAGASGGVKSGSNYETAYTYCNLILANSVSADDGTAYAFSGTQDGFEGNANLYGTSYGDAAKDKTKAMRTFFYAGMQVGKTGAEKTLFDFTNDASTPNYAKTKGTYRYVMWDTNVYNQDEKDGAFASVRLVDHEDMAGTNQIDMFKALRWITFNRINGSMKADYYRMINSAITYQAEWNNIGDADRYQGKDYLPHARINTQINAISDSLTRKQSSLGLALPIPSGIYDRGLSVFSLSLEEGNTYGVIYPIDADQVNIEFSQDLVDQNGYFILGYGDAVVDKQLITKRVYTYSYDYLKNLTLNYGFVDMDGFEAKMEADGYEAEVDDTPEDIFDHDDYIYSYDSIACKSASLERHVMVYGSEYYYISDEGVVHGTGSSVASDDNDRGTTAGEGGADEDETDGEETQIIDTTAQVMSGSYITIYNGHALTEDGSVVDVTSGNTVRSVSGCTPLEYVVPVQSFTYDEYTVESYAKFAEVIGSDIVPKETQILKGYTGVVGFIDGNMENIKDSMLLYSKNDKEYQTILGTDGIMVDLYQGDDISAPEDFKRSGIVYMTNNLNCSVPFVLVEYQNGGIVGYNYMTGEYLFDHSFTNQMSLMDYTRVYFEGDKSMYERAYSTYAANQKVAEIVGTPERLLELVEGNTNDIDVEGNSTGDGTESENEDAEKAGEDGAKTGNETAAAENGIASDGIKEENTVSVGDGEGNDTGDHTVETTDGIVSEGIAENTNDGTENSDGTGQSSNIEENGITSTVPGAEGAVSMGEAGQISGEGQGNGEIVVTGTALGNGKNTVIGDSIGGASNESAAEGNSSGNSTGASATTADIAEGADALPENNMLSEGAAGGDNDDRAGSGQGSGTGDDAGNGQGSGTGDGAGNGQESGDGNGAGSSDVTDKTVEDKTVKVSTAGTPIVEAKGGINNGKSDIQNLGTLDDEEEAADELVAETVEKTLITVYNQATGTYEIVDLKQYFNVSVYKSENQKLGISDLSVYAGFAPEKEEKKSADGLMLYVLVAFAVVGVVAFTYHYRKKNKLK